MPEIKRRLRGRSQAGRYNMEGEGQNDGVSERRKREGQDILGLKDRKQEIARKGRRNEKEKPKEG
jgi:hypothetical protein